MPSRGESLIIIFHNSKATACFHWGGQLQICPSHGGRDPHLTQCVTEPHRCTCQVAFNPMNSLSRGIDVTDEQQNRLHRNEQE